MKAVILAGGFGTRISEETHLRPKPMIEIGGRPILWHIMKIYSAQGIQDFVICLGYKGYLIKEYFANYFLHVSDVTFDISNNQMSVLNNSCEPWRVTLIDTGEDTMTGGRLKRVAPYLENEDFCFTYGDGLCDVNLQQLIAFHKTQKALATVTAIQPPGRYGALTMAGCRITHFYEKPQTDGAWVNGGFFILSPGALKYIEGDHTIWEREPMEALALNGELCAFRHEGFWKGMDTLRDKNFLEELWASGNAPWKIWE